MDNELVPQPSWWKRNWKWVLPLGGCMTLIVLLVMFLGSIFFGVTKMFEESAPYEYALEKINKDDQMIELLGSPIERDGIMSGNYEWKNGAKSADMSIPIAGPKNSGILYIRATGNGDEWTYHEIRVVVRDSEEFNLLESDWE